MSKAVIARARSARSNPASKTRLLRSARNDAPQDFLLEIGCEELPADYLPTVLDRDNKGPGLAGGLASSAKIALDKEEIVWKELQSFATPRRLVLVVRGVSPKVHKTEEGPPVSIAFDASGNLTDAAKGFAKKQGVPFSMLKRKSTPKGERLVLERAIPAEEVLAKAIPLIVQRIVFPKTMRWDDSGVKFARPIRWLLALYGSKVVTCTVGFLESNRLTYGLRRGSGSPVRVASAGTYSSTMDRLHVKFEHGLIWKQTAEAPPMDCKFEEVPRKKSEDILRELTRAAKQLGGRLQDPSPEEFDWLLNTVTFLAEDPVVEVGSFQESFLDLPAEVLATSMAKHLKLFSVYDSEGRMLPKFLAVLEGEPTNADEVMGNIERILEARFTDARFFYREDTKTSLEAKVPELSKVIFHEKLGTVSDRIPRLERLMKSIATQLKGLDDLVRPYLTPVAQLCKADLVTQMVREFPSLQGVVGGFYVRKEGKPEPVFQAITEQYRPRTANDPLPSRPLGAMIGLADRFDTLIGYFGVGLKPTGSLDPYGLRRHALGIVRILTEFTSSHPWRPAVEPSVIHSSEGLFFRRLSIDTILDEGIQSWGAKLTVGRETLKKELKAFILERFEWLQRHSSEDQPLIEAVLAAVSDDLADAKERLDLLRFLWKNHTDGSDRKQIFLKAAKVAERTTRIVRAAAEKGKYQIPLVLKDSSVLKETAEKELLAIWRKKEDLIQRQLSHRKYEEAVETYSALYPNVHEFFEKVFVMSEDANLKWNRIGLLNEIHQSLAAHFADLAKLPLAGIEPT